MGTGAEMHLAVVSGIVTGEALISYREEKSLRHVAMVAKFSDDNKSKRHLKSGFALFQLHQSYLISFNLSNVGEIFWVECERTVSKLRKRKRNLLHSH